jgi:hypothetical protein
VRLVVAAIVCATFASDQGFIFNCRAYNGCACVVSRLQAFDRAGRILESQDWLAPTCRRR